MSRRLSISSFFKSKTSNKLSVDTGSPQSPTQQSPVQRSPAGSDCDSPVSYVSIPGISPARRFATFLSGTSSQSSGVDYAEEMEDDNMAWGKPRKQARARR